MFIQRFILVLAAVAAAAPLSAQTLITNGDFKLTQAQITDVARLPHQIGAWQAAYGHPRIIVGKGCRDANSIAMQGEPGGEAIRQPVALMKGVRYGISLCARSGKDEKSKSHVELRASTTPLDSPKCPVETCETMTGAKGGSGPKWETFHFQFTPSRNYAYLTLSASNAEVDNVSVTVATEPGEPAPLINADARNVIRDQYIVLYKRGTSESEAEALERQLNPKDILFTYRVGILGFAARLRPEALKIVRANPHVQWVEADQRMRSSSVEGPVMPAGACLDAALATGIDRIDQRRLPLNDTFQFAETGQRVHVYLLDSSIRTTHQEFGKRASSDFSVFTDNPETDDCAVHGTHVAGTVGGNNYGVARQARLHSVRVMNCRGEGDVSQVIDGVEWVTAQACLPAVALMSISGENLLPTLQAAVTLSIDSGVTYVVAAHNRARDACNYSPANIPRAITVGAVNGMSDKRYVTSNHGPCVDLFAPGTAILSAGSANNTARACLSGTSMAAAHVAGVAALYLQLHPGATPADVWDGIHYNNNVATTSGWAGIGNPGSGSPIELLHWGPLNDGYDDGESCGTSVPGPYPAKTVDQ